MVLPPPAPSSGLSAFTESAQTKQSQKKKQSPKSTKNKLNATPAIRYTRIKKSKTAAISFDEAARADYLTGFGKRKQQRKEAGREFLRLKEKEAQLLARTEAREAKKERAAENVRAERRAFGIESGGEESDGDGLGDGDDDEQDAETVPQILNEEYDTEDHHTTVVVESFDLDQELYKQEEHAARTSRAKAKPTQEASSSGASKPTSTATVEALPPSSARTKKANASGQGQETQNQNSTQPPPDTIQKRLHVSGLTENFTQEELIRRFSTFGTVVSLDEWPGAPDANRALRPFAYVTLQATPAQISKCMNSLSGSVWKGAKLRIGEAKLDYRQKWAKQEELEKQKQDAAQSSLKKRRLPSHVGVEAKDIMSPVTEQDVKEGLWGWKKTPAGHLIRPLYLRPERPIAKAQAVKVSGTDKNGQATTRTTRLRVNPIPPKRAHRITIDPTRYGAVHVTGSILDNLFSDQTEPIHLSGGAWQCQEVAENEATDSSTRSVVWRYVAADGNVLHQETTRLAVRKVAQPLALTDVYPKHAMQDTFANDQVRALFGQDDDDDDDFDLENDSLADLEDGEFSDGGSDLFSDLRTVETSHVQPSASEDKAQETKTATSSAAAAVGRPKQVTNTPYDADAESEFSDGYQEEDDSVPPVVGRIGDDLLTEKSKTLNLLGNVFGVDFTSKDDADQAPLPIYTPVEGDASDSELNQDESAASSGDEKCDKGQDTEESVQSVQSMQQQQDTKESMQQQEPLAPTESDSNQESISMAKLKDMFQPQEETRHGGGFSLMGGLGQDMDLDSDLDFGADDEQDSSNQAVEQEKQRQEAMRPSVVARGPHAWYDNDGSMPELFMRFDSSKRRRIVDTILDSQAGTLLDGEQQQQQQEVVGYMAFCRTDSMDQIEEKWNERKTSLTQDYKRRHREALKKKKRKVIGNHKQGAAAGWK